MDLLPIEIKYLAPRDRTLVEIYLDPEKEKVRKAEEEKTKAEGVVEGSIIRLWKEFRDIDTVVRLLEVERTKIVEVLKGEGIQFD